MEYKEIKKLMEDMGNSKLSELEIEFPDGIKISMKKDEGAKVVTPVSSPVMPVSTNLTVNQTENVNTTVPEVKKEEKEGNVVKSPMVGTFYSKSSPSAAPYVKIGSKVKKGDTLCIIEAMKLMNEIESEFDGVVADILVSDEQMVDYGKPLFIIK